MRLLVGLEVALGDEEDYITVQVYREKQAPLVLWLRKRFPFSSLALLSSLKLS